MAELVARDKQAAEQWRHRLPPGEEVLLGREGAWATPWDGKISRKHADLLWQEGRLRVRRQPTGRNPIVFSGEVADEFTLGPGQEFIIGETTFTVEETDAAPSGDLPTPYTELTCSSEELQQVPYPADLDRIEVLAALPGVIRYSCSEKELEGRVVDVLLRGLPRAEVAAVVRLGPESAAGSPQVEVIRARRRQGEAPDWRPSRRLVFDAVARRRQSVLHLWAPGSLRP
ncbi:MAG TPA: hypothetical protein VJ739_00975, partial [Gemmataceae bacterium]|nr:hypothetical protein [Gemmataceae bacterium]